MLSKFMCNVYNYYASGLISKDSLPYFADHVGFRSKFVPFEIVVNKLGVGRCIGMLDELE